MPGCVLCVSLQVPVIANNRVGEEVFAKSSIKFYGGSFISGQHGQVLAQVRRLLIFFLGLGWWLGQANRDADVRS
jgi:hypothetical protein